MIHYHGTPITPQATLYELAGRHFCVSFAAPDQVKIVHQIGQSVMLDNGAFSVWQQGRTIDWDEWEAWAEPWLDWPTTWAVLPDVIDGDEADNDLLLSRYGHWADGLRGNLAPVWHLHESLERLQHLTHNYGRTCFGSSGQYREVGSEAWHRRVTDAFNAISSPSGQVPWIHMLRGMSLSGDIYPFGSVDSTDIARNHNRPQNGAVAMAARWDAMQPPGRWTPHKQLQLAEAHLGREGERRYESWLETLKDHGP